MYKKILVPLDGSPRAERILPYVEEIAVKFGSRIVFMQIVEPNVSMVSPYDIAPYNIGEETKRHVSEARTYLAGIEGEFRAKGLEAKSCVEDGPVVPTILDVAEREDAELIAMASHGYRGFARFVYGSVAADVLHRANAPMLILRIEPTD